MKYGIYVIKDSKVAFDVPFCDTNDQSAVRGFTFAINRPDQMMNANPNDYFLFKVGEFDNENGKIKAITPDLICSGIDVYRSE